MPTGLAVFKAKEALKHLEKAELSARSKMEALKLQNPFWFFQPSDGSITDEGQKILKQYLKPEDIPQRLDGQKDVFTSKANIVGISGGNQSGKTCSMVMRRLILATGLIPPSLKAVFPAEIIQKKTPRRYRVVGVDLINGLEKNVIPSFKYWVPRECLRNGKWEDSWSAKSNTLALFDPKTRHLLSTIEFMSAMADVSSHQGPAMDGVDFDEEPPYDIYRENAVRLTTAQRYDMQFGMTPTHGISWIYDRFFLRREDSGNNIDWFKLASITNSKANPVSIEENLKTAESYAEIKMRLLGDFVSLSGLIYGNLFDTKIHLITPFALNKEDYVVYRGLDPHTAKPTACCEVAVDREGTKYVCGMYMKAADTQVLKDDLAQRAKDRNYRLGWTNCDKSADTTNRLLNDRNIFDELRKGVNAIPALRRSEKFTGSIAAGVDEIKKGLKIDPLTKKPSLVIFDTPENEPLVHAFKMLERDTYNNEAKKGLKDRINEGPYDAHAALRYTHQSIMNFYPQTSSATPEMDEVNEATGY